MELQNPSSQGAERFPSRVVIDRVEPEVEAGRYPIKRVVGEEVEVTANIYADGHDQLAAVVRYRAGGEDTWREAPMRPLGNDRWKGSFRVTRLGRYEYTFEAWTDRFGTWQHGLGKKVEAGQDVAMDLLVGAELLAQAAGRASAADREKLLGAAAVLKAPPSQGGSKSVEVALSGELNSLATRYADRSLAGNYGRRLGVVVDREKARFSAWYEMFPRACASVAGLQGTFKDCEARLSYIAGMGFDVLYFPPIHPIGRVHRKGKNNGPSCGPGEVGSPWAIGSAEGGHKSIHPQLGTLEDFRRLVAKAGEFGIEVALDIAFQCAPDHPWVREHPEWFRKRPDGSVQYAENPPKKYEDIYPLNFETDRWRELWEELKSVVVFWMEQGVRIFRVDNPHTKPFAFWEWLIGEVKSACPEVTFLAEAFTRPAVMYHLSKLGFTESYTYFAWRNTRWELTQYFTELAETPLKEFFRPSLWPNTPDILTEYLQTGGRPAFMARLVLAATLGAHYGIYGPAFELCENRPLRPGSEEYLDSDKYEIRAWDINRADSLRHLIGRVNRIRRENPALQRDSGLRFHSLDNGQLIAYSKATADRSNVILVVVNLDPHYTQSGWVDLPLDELGIEQQQEFEVHDLLTGARYLWHGARNYVELNPQLLPAHILRLRHRGQAERDVDPHMDGANGRSGA